MAIRITHHGFTLVEMLIVISMIAILSVSGVFFYQNGLKSARDAKRKSDLENIRGALELYRSNNDVYPPALDTACTGSTGLTDATNTYLSLIPKDPRCDSQNYYYEQISATDYTLGGLLETSSVSSCGNCGSAACNYCLGPFGQK